MLDPTKGEVYLKQIAELRELAIRFAKTEKDQILESVHICEPTSVEEVNEEYFASGFIHGILAMELAKEIEMERYINKGGSIDLIDLLDTVSFIEGIVRTKEEEKRK